MGKLKSLIAVEQGAIVGADAVSVLLAALGSRPKKLMENLSITSYSKIKASSKETKSSKRPWDSISLQSPGMLKTKLTMVDFKLREMCETAQPGKSHTLQEIADFVGVSRERIRQIEEKGLRRVRNTMRKIIKEDGLELEEFHQ